ncbi:MAG: ribosome silencing factor [Planctomycetota bacterium]|jgi:ribosome-associated protein
MSANATPGTKISGKGTFFQFVRETLDDKRAENIVALDLRGVSSIADEFLIATISNPRQASAIVDTCEKERKARGLSCLGIEGTGGSSWVVLDYGDLVVHMFTADAREYYGLEFLWSDAKRID